MFDGRRCSNGSNCRRSVRSSAIFIGVACSTRTTAMQSIEKAQLALKIKNKSAIKKKKEKFNNQNQIKITFETILHSKRRKKKNQKSKSNQNHIFKKIKIINNSKFKLKTHLIALLSEFRNDDRRPSRGDRGDESPPVAEVPSSKK